MSELTLTVREKRRVKKYYNFNTFLKSSELDGCCGIIVLYNFPTDEDLTTVDDKTGIKGAEQYCIKLLEEEVRSLLKNRDLARRAEGFAQCIVSLIPEQNISKKILKDIGFRVVSSERYRQRDIHKVLNPITILIYEYNKE